MIKKKLTAIFVMVVLSHAALCAFFLRAKSPEPKKCAKLVVHHVKLAPPPKPSPKPKVKPKSKSPAPKKMAKKSPQKKLAKKSPQKKNSAKAKKLLQAAEKSLATLGKLPKQKKVETPDKPITLCSDTTPDAPLSSVDQRYEEELAQRIALFLRLPEYGDVKVKLILTREGMLAKLELLSSPSEANRRYVTKALGGLAYPPFGGAYSKELTHAFALTLRGNT